VRTRPEWFGKTDDTRIPDRVRLRVLDRYHQFCASCGFLIVSADWQCDHITALINGGEHRESNLQPLHLRCHSIKTANDLLASVITARKRKRHFLRKPRSITAWRRFDGTIVRKPRER
jgi:5-methylcytosine-specific restriction endonuclease McrA